MEIEAAIKAFDEFLALKQDAVGHELAAAREVPDRLSAGWAFYYQTRAYLQTGELQSFLVGQGPVVIRDDGTIIEGFSLDRDPEALLTHL